MQTKLILALNIILITISNCSNHYFTAASPATSDITCASGQDCYVSCLGVNACKSIITQPGSEYSIIGPSNYQLTIDVDSGCTTLCAGETFTYQIICADCSKLNIAVDGAGWFTFRSNRILTPQAGLTTFDCSGITIPGASNGGVCYNIHFFGSNGMGVGSGQVYIVDVSAMTGRLDITTVRYVCVDMTGSNLDSCGIYLGSGTMQWNSNGYLECLKQPPLTCQITPSPVTVTTGPPSIDAGCVYSLEDYLDNCYCGITPSPTTAPPTTATANTAATARNVLFVESDATSPFVTVSEFDYYFMRVCMVIVLIQFCVVMIGFMIKAFVGALRDCNKKSDSYSQVKYHDHSDMSDNEH